MSNKEFNLTEKHFDQFVIIQRKTDEVIEIEPCDCCNTIALELRKRQAIAIAKHFKLTEDDLK